MCTSHRESTGRCDSWFREGPLIHRLEEFTKKVERLTKHGILHIFSARICRKISNFADKLDLRCMNNMGFQTRFS